MSRPERPRPSFGSMIESSTSTLRLSRSKARANESSYASFYDSISLASLVCLVLYSLQTLSYHKLRYSHPLFCIETATRLQV